MKVGAIFGQFLPLIQDEIKGSYRTKAVIYGYKVTGNFRHIADLQRIQY
jgi:hypothetical protein